MGSAPMGFPSSWAATCVFPPLPPSQPPPPPSGPPLLPGGPPPLPDGSALPVKALGCMWVVMAMAIDIFVLMFSMVRGVMGNVGTVVDRLIRD